MPLPPRRARLQPAERQRAPRLPAAHDPDGVEFVRHLASRPRAVSRAMEVLLRFEAGVLERCARAHPNVAEEAAREEVLASAERCAADRAYAGAYDPATLALEPWFHSHVLRRVAGHSFLACVRSGAEEDGERALELLLASERTLLSRLAAKLSWLSEAVLLDAVRDVAGSCVTERWRSFDPARGTLEGWFLMVVHNEVLGRARSELRRVDREAHYQPLPRHPSPAQAAVLQDGLDLVERRIRTILRGKKRRILENDLARAFDRPELPAPLADAELARELDVQLNTLYAMRAKARGELAPHIEELFADG